DIKTGRIIGRGTKKHGLYYVDEVTQSGIVMLAHGTIEREAWLWHRRLGHPSASYLHTLFPELFPNVIVDDCTRPQSHASNNVAATSLLLILFHTHFRLTIGSHDQRRIKVHLVDMVINRTTMLRTKQLGTLSQSARSFFLSGTRCSADGSSCTCLEDETCTSKRQFITKNGPRTPQTASTIIPKTSTRVLNSTIPDSKIINNPVSASHLPRSTAIAKTECVTYADETDTMHPVGLTATGHIVRAGMAAVNFLNDVVNYKIPLNEGSASVESTPNYVAENTHSSNNKTYRKVEPETISSNNTTKTYKKVKPQASVLATRPNNKSSPNVNKGRDEKYVSGKNQSQNYNTAKGVPKKSKECVNHFMVCQQEWKNAMDVEMDALMRNETWEKCVLPHGRKPVGYRWIFTVKYKPDRVIDRYKAQLVAKGYTQTYGIDYSETLSPVAKIDTIRVLFSITSNQGWPLHQFDVKNAFLHGDLKEELYMEAPPGFSHSFRTREVSRLKRSLYGLKQSPRAWFGRFTLAMKKYGFKQSNSDHTLFLKHKEGRVTCLIIYVDDMIITGNDEKEIKKLKEGLFTEFEMKDLGRLKYFLGIEIYTDADWVEDKGTRKSTSRYFSLVGGNLVTWRSKKQKVVALSSAEAEFRGITKGVA
nr:putative ribonuclease H-like domain-containing protein [Tanacetum cinerariifolium]